MVDTTGLGVSTGLDFALPVHVLRGNAGGLAAGKWFGAGVLGAANRAEHAVDSGVFRAAQNTRGDGGDGVFMAVGRGGNLGIFCDGSGGGFGDAALSCVGLHRGCVEFHRDAVEPGSGWINFRVTARS